MPRAEKCACGAAKVTVRVRDGKRTTHDGIKVEFVGNIGTSFFLFLVFLRHCEREGGG